MGLKSSVFHCAQTIGAEMALIFDGRSRFYVNGFQLDLNQERKFLLKTPIGPEYIRFNSFILTGLGCELDVYEGSDRDGDTVLHTYNSNRNKPDISNTEIYDGVTGGTTDGVLLKRYFLGANTGNPLVDSGGSCEDNPKVILKKNTKYTINLKSQGNGNNITIGLWWLEFEATV